MSHRQKKLTCLYRLVALQGNLLEDDGRLILVSADSSPLKTLEAKPLTYELQLKLTYSDCGRQMSVEYVVTVIIINQWRKIGGIRKRPTPSVVLNFFSPVHHRLHIPRYCLSKTSQSSMSTICPQGGWLPRYVP
jgi:hypothetical protein